MDASHTLFYKKILVLLTLSTTLVSSVVPGTSRRHQENLQKLATANNYFALNLHRRLITQTTENTFFSPLSLSMAFGMLLYGARGDTAKELRSTLGYQSVQLPDELVHAMFNRFLVEMLPRNSSGGYTMNVANAVLVDKHLQLLPDYKNAAQNLYRAAVQNVNFAKDASKIKNGINNWVKTKTRGKIERLLEDLSTDTIMIILNAVYFKGLWKIPFHPQDTTQRLFYNNGLQSQAKSVPMMFMRKIKFPYTITENYQALELPYAGDRISMMIILPNQRNGLLALEESLTPEKMASIRRQMRRTEVTLSLPKFRIEYSKSLEEELKALGMVKMFRYQTADFSGISRTTGLEVSQVVHKAFVEVNEAGTEAAAATGISIMAMSASLQEERFIADHPFLFTIFDKGSDMILFLGRVVNL